MARAAALVRRAPSAWLGTAGLAAGAGDGGAPPWVGKAGGRGVGKRDGLSECRNREAGQKRGKAQFCTGSRLVVCRHYVLRLVPPRYRDKPIGAGCGDFAAHLSVTVNRLNGEPGDSQ